ncbi:MAG TPA: hypothetical protein VGB20_02220 [bacterium]
MTRPSLSLPSLSPTERLMALVCAFALGLVALDRLAIGPWWRHIQDVRADIRELEDTLQVHRRLLERRPQIDARIAAYEEHLRLAGARDVELATLLREIEDFGDKSGLVIGEVRPVEEPVAGSYQARAFEFQFQGSLSEWMRFVYLLETSPSMFQVRRATVGLQEEAGGLSGTIRVLSLGITATDAAGSSARGAAAPGDGDASPGG